MGLRLLSIGDIEMKRLLELAATLMLVAGMTGTAAAQGLSETAGVVEGPGVKLGEATVVHPTLGAEAGVISNVFYEEADTTTAGVLRILAQLHYASLSAQRIAAEAPEEGGSSQGEFQFRAGLNLAYEEFLSTNDNVQKQRDVAVSADFRGVVFPERTFMFTFGDEFVRQSRPTNFESPGSVDRDVNILNLAITFQPGGRALSAALRYQNRIDFFEEENHKFANRIQHTFGLRGTWQWLPVTAFYADASIGIYDGLGGDADAKISSNPLKLAVGTSTAITTLTTLNAEVGYTKGFYSEGPDYSAVIFSADFGWRYSPLGRLRLAYRYYHDDSINASFYRDHQIRLALAQQFDRFTFTGDVDVRFRHYENTILVNDEMTRVRDDVIIAFNAGGRYHLRDWLAATIDYRFVSDQTDFRDVMGGDDPSYVRHEIMAGVLGAF